MAKHDRNMLADSPAAEGANASNDMTATMRSYERQPGGEKFSIVIPVLNEIDNLPVFMGELDDLISRKQLREIGEIVFVDDGSTDGTLDFLDSLAADKSKGYSVRVLKRSTKLGSANAELAGCKIATYDTILKMDSDMQHPIRYIEDLVRAWNPDLDLLVASRYLEGGGNDWSPLRGIISRSAQMIARIFIRNSGKLSDPLSGFFVLRKALVLHLLPVINTKKLLLYVLATKRDIKVGEIPYVMKDRLGGESKIVDNSMKFVQQYFIEILTYWKLARKIKRASDRGGS